VTNLTEELIKAAMAKQAERAPHPGPIINALQQPHRRPRRVWPLVIALLGTAAVAAAIAIPALRTTTALEPAKPPKLQIPIAYTIGAVPEGFYEFKRTSDLNTTSQTRVWKASRSDGMLSLTVVHRGGDDYWFELLTKLPFLGTPVVVNGVSGYSIGDGGKPDGIAQVAWQPDPNTYIEVTMSKVPGQNETVQTVAQSVRPDGKSTVCAVASFGQLPPAYKYVTVVVAGTSPTDASGWIEATGPDQKPYITAGVHVDKGARYGPGSPLVRPVPGGRVLVVADQSETPVTSHEELTEIANAVTVEPNPDFSWVGGH
jgi:hypothetical protein